MPPNRIMAMASPIQCFPFLLNPEPRTLNVLRSPHLASPLATLAGDLRLVSDGRAWSCAGGANCHAHIWRRPRHGILPADIRAKVILLLRAPHSSHPSHQRTT